MRYSRYSIQRSGTSPFHCRQGNHLWEASIPDRNSLKKHASSSTVFVAIDVEPFGLPDGKLAGYEIAQIGITLLAAPWAGSHDTGALIRPTSLGVLRKSFDLRSHCIDISGRVRRNPRNDEFCWGEPTVVDAENMEDAILKVLDTADVLLPTASGTKPDLCLIGFDLGLELRVISSLYPRILQRFSSWVDLQDLVMEIAGPGCTKQPSMRDTLVSFGFQAKLPMVRVHGYKHDAGNDSVRVIAILLNLLTYNSTLKIERDQKRRRGKGPGRISRDLFQDGRFFMGRPRPLESFPFATRVSLKAHDGPSFTAKKLYDLFIPTYSLVATGAPHNYFGPNAYAWVCLSSLEELNRFVTEVHGTACEDCTWRGTWEATSFYDPSLTPAVTADELKEWLRARDEAAEQEKLLSRARKRQQEQTDPADFFEGGLVFEDEDSH